MAYLTFQTVFFDRFIACFKIQGNAGFFITLNDFLGYMGTVAVLSLKELIGSDMDWAGTAVDFGCFAPLNAFLKVFSEERGIDITYRQAREPMGLLKIDPIRAILGMPEVNGAFEARYRRPWNSDDVNEMYRSFEKHLFASLEDFTTPIPGVVETIERLRGAGIRIGSTTGYTQAMMHVVRPAAARKGYTVDHLVTPDDVPAGRLLI